jgi:hypothetical protein
MSTRATLCGLWLVAACGVDAPTVDVAVTIDWAESAARPLRRTLHGHNTVWSRGGLGLWDDAAGAVSAEARDRVTALAPGVLRFPGGTRAMRYHFDEVIGPVDGRVPQCDTFTGELDGTGYGLDEFLALAEDLGAQVTLVAPWVDGSPEEAAALVAYVNGDAASTVVIGVDARGKDWGTAGEWAARRAANGRAEPWGALALEVGNEPYLSQSVGPAVSCGRASRFRQSERWVGDTVIPTTAADYAAELARTAALVRQIDPELLIGAPAYASYDGTSDAVAELGDVDRELGTGDGWNARLIADAGEAFDFFVLHPYDFSTTDSRSRLADRMRKVITDLRTLAPAKRIAVTEFGFLIGGGTLRSGLCAADVLRVAAEEDVLMTLRHILIEDDPSGPFAESAAILGPERTRTPGYLVMELLARTLGDAWQPAQSSAEDLVVLATRDAIVLLDRRVDAIDVRTVSVPWPGAASGTQTTITGRHLDVIAADVAVTTAPIAGRDLLLVQVPPGALVVLELRP